MPYLLVGGALKQYSEAIAKFQNLLASLDPPHLEFWISAREIMELPNKNVMEAIWEVFIQNGVNHSMKQYYEGAQIEFLWDWDESKMAYHIRVYEGRDARILKEMKNAPSS